MHVIYEGVLCTQVFLFQSSQLLSTLLYHMEEHVTHHIQTVISGLYKACQDDEKIVVEQVLSP